MISVFYVVLFINTDFVVSSAILDQQYPVVQFVNGQYYCMWQDMRYYSPDRSIFGARITQDGVVLDPFGRLILRDRAMNVDFAFDGVNFLAVVQDSC